MNITHEQVTRMTVAEFRRFKRAVQTLLRIGVPFEKAVTIILEARMLWSAEHPAHR